MVSSEIDEIILKFVYDKDGISNLRDKDGSFVSVGRKSSPFGKEKTGSIPHTIEKNKIQQMRNSM